MDVALCLGDRFDSTFLLFLATAHGKRDAVHEGRILAFGQKRGVVGDGFDERIEPFRVGLGEIAQYMTVDARLVAGMADAETQPAIILAAMGVDGTDTVVAAGAATLLDAGLAGYQVEFVFYEF